MGELPSDTTPPLPPEENAPGAQKNPILSKVEQSNLFALLYGGGLREKKRLIAWKAKEKGKDPEAILLEMREYAKARINCPEKVLHFHRTSPENFQDIVELGGLLSRSEIKKRKPEKALPSWSASDDVMFTRDSYNPDGQLEERGLGEHGVGASGGEVVLVMGPNLMALDNYDALSKYPTVSDAPLEKNCKTILVQTESDSAAVKAMLGKAQIKGVGVELRGDWEKKHYTEA